MAGKQKFMFYSDLWASASLKMYSAAWLSFYIATGDPDLL
jgi:hypothetical protein